MSISLTEDRPMRLSTMPNQVFWPIWVLVLGGVVASFVWGILEAPPLGRALAIGVYVVGLVALVITAVARQRKRNPARITPAARRYLMRFLPSMLLYALGLILAIWLYKHHKPTGVVAYAVAALPALPIMGAIWAIGRFFVEQEDEFQRRIMVESYLWATGATLAICTAVGFLQAFDLVPAIQLWTVFPLLAICLVPAQGWVKWKYR